MKVKQFSYANAEKFTSDWKAITASEPNVVMVFAGRKYFENAPAWKSFSSSLPNVTVIGCSTAGEIGPNGVSDDTIQISSLQTNGQKFQTGWATVTSADKSFDAGKDLAEKFKKDNLKTIFVLSPGLDVNGSAVLDGIRSVVGKDVVVTGGLAGDGANFQKTFTLLNESVSERNLVALASYGNDVEVTYGSMGGWEPFGPVRKVTKSKNNVLFEIDGEPALDLYKKYLGKEAEKLPASGLLYPFAILKGNQDTSGLIRTILSVDEKTKSLMFAGDIAEGSFVRLMTANNTGLSGGARDAAKLASKNSQHTGIAVLISCVGRKLVMGDEIEDEVDAVRETFGKDVPLTGFYSYGEICPQHGFSECKLHNQTMTITHLNVK